LLDVHVLAGLATPDGGEGVPVVGRRDGDGGHGLVVEDLANVLLDLRRLLLFLVDALERVGNDVRIDFAQVGEFGVFHGGKALYDGLAAARDGDDGEDDLLIRTIGGAEGVQGRERGGGTGEECATIHGCPSSGKVGC